MCTSELKTRQIHQLKTTLVARYLLSCLHKDHVSLTFTETLFCFLLPITSQHSHKLQGYFSDPNGQNMVLVKLFQSNLNI